MICVVVRAFWAGLQKRRCFFNPTCWARAGWPSQEFHLGRPGVVWRLGNPFLGECGHLTVKSGVGDSDFAVRTRIISWQLSFSGMPYVVGMGRLSSMRAWRAMNVR